MKTIIFLRFQFFNRLINNIYKRESIFVLFSLAILLRVITLIYCFRSYSNKIIKMSINRRIKGKRSDNCIWQSVSCLNYPIYEEFVFYCCQEAETISYSRTKGLSSHTYTVFYLLSSLSRLSLKVVRPCLFNLSS